MHHYMLALLRRKLPHLIVEADDLPAEQIYCFWLRHFPPPSAVDLHIDCNLCDCARTKCARYQKRPSFLPAAQSSAGPPFCEVCPSVSILRRRSIGLCWSNPEPSQPERHAGDIWCAQGLWSLRPVSARTGQVAWMFLLCRTSTASKGVKRCSGAITVSNLALKGA